MSFWERMQNVDKRIIYLLLFGVISLALIKPVGLAIAISPGVQKVYDSVAALPAGSIMFVSLDHGASNNAELLGGELGVIRQALAKGVKIVGTGMWAEAGSLLDSIWQTVSAEYPDKKYGTDFVNLGYRAGQRVYLEQLISDVSLATNGEDHFGAKIADMPLMQEFTSLSQADMVYEAISGSPGEKEMIATVTDPHHIPFIASMVSVSVTSAQPFVQSGQIIEMIPGLSGSAQYEVLVNKPGAAVAGSDAQSFAHVLVVAFMVFGNLGFLLSPKKGHGAKK